jgi:hypothetical protein
VAAKQGDQDVTIRNVNGHKDDKRDYVDLTWPEQLYVLADHLVTAALTEFYSLLAIFFTPPSISPVTNSARSEPNLLSTSCERNYRTARIGQTSSTLP